MDRDKLNELLNLYDDMMVEFSRLNGELQNESHRMYESYRKLYGQLCEWQYRLEA